MSDARLLGAALAATVLFAVTPEAWAQQLGPNGAPIDTSSYTIDLYRGPVQGASRLVGLAGAYTGLAEGITGYRHNPASVVYRNPWSATWFDWEIDGGFTLPASITTFDFDNNGEAGFANSAAFFGTAGLGLKFGDFGVGANFDLQLFDLDARGGAERSLSVSVLDATLLFGHRFLEGQLQIGGGVGVTNVTVDDAVFGGQQGVVGSIGVPSLHFGAIWAPLNLPVRAGLSGRWSPPPDANVRPECQPPNCEEVDGNFISSGYFLPRSLTLPPEVRTGIAIQLFRPMNLKWHNPHDYVSDADRYEAAIASRRKRRREETDDRLAQARRTGADVDALRDQLEAESDRLDDEEDDNLDHITWLERRTLITAYRHLVREKLLISLAARLTFPVDDAVGLESFLDQRVERKGAEFTLQPSLGVEAEVWPGNLVLRGGSYLEPSRFEAALARFHGTFGLDWRLPFTWSVFGIFERDTSFQIGGAIDASSRYFSWSLGFGIWR